MENIDQFLPSEDQVINFLRIANTRPNRSQTEILVVEDQAFSRKLLLGFLGNNYKVSAVETAEEALKMYLKKAPDIVFLDIELPGDINGHQFAAIIKKVDPNAFIVMVTSHTQRDDVICAKENGAKGFVVKPYSKQKILDSIQQFQRQQ